MFVQRRDTGGAGPRRVSWGNLNIKTPFAPSQDTTLSAFMCLLDLLPGGRWKQTCAEAASALWRVFGLFNKVVGRLRSGVLFCLVFSAFARKLLFIHGASSTGAPPFPASLLWVSLLHSRIFIMRTRLVAIKRRHRAPRLPRTLTGVNKRVILFEIVNLKTRHLKLLWNWQNPNRSFFFIAPPLPPSILSAFTS